MPCLNFTLYLDSTFPRNLWTDDIRSLTRLCQKFGGDHYSIEIVHLANARRRGFHDGVFTTPTILLETTGGRKQILGNMVETELFLRSLDPHAPAAKASKTSPFLKLFPSLRPMLS
jgi:hypothetical protein